MKKHNSHFWLRLFEIFLLVIAFCIAFFLLAAGTKQYWLRPDVEAKIANSSEIDPNDAVRLLFNQPADHSAVEQSLRISPSTRVSFDWKKNFTELEIKPADFFEPGREHLLEFEARQGIFGMQKKSFNLKYGVRDLPRVISATPEKDEQGVNTNSDFKLAFSHSVHDFNIEVKVEPAGSFKWETNADKTALRIFSEKKLDYEAAYSMKVLVQPASNGKPAPQEEIFASVFQTEKKPAAQKSNSAVIPEGEVVDFAARITEGKYIDINLAKQHLSIFENAVRLGTFRISSGKRGMATPTGNFKIMGKRGKAWSNKYKLFMPFWMQFTGMGHGIHELPEWPGGYKEGAAHLGIPVSHGCVRLGIGPAQTVYDFSSVGTPVVIHY